MKASFNNQSLLKVITPPTSEGKTYLIIYHLRSWETIDIGIKLEGRHWAYILPRILNFILKPKSGSQQRFAEMVRSFGRSSEISLHLVEARMDAQADLQYINWCAFPFALNTNLFIFPPSSAIPRRLERKEWLSKLDIAQTDWMGGWKGIEKRKS